MSDSTCLFSGTFAEFADYIRSRKVLRADGLYEADPVATRNAHDRVIERLTTAVLECLETDR